MSKRYSKDPKIQALVEEKVKAGWQVRSGKKHDVLVAPNNRTLGIASTPSDRRNAHKNFATDLKKIAQPFPKNHVESEWVVNWHITEACNFACQYCFAKWEQKQHQEILHHAHKVQRVLDELCRLPEIMLRQKNVDVKKVRLNLVGGETFLYEKAVKFIIEQAKQRGFALSAISNGSLFSDDWAQLIAQDFVSMGFSVDSLKPETNLKIGRHQKNKLISAEQMAQHIHLLHQLNPKLSLKINTVVNELNYQELFHDWLRDLPVDKWKVFKMLPIINHCLSINDEKFQQFIHNHRAFQPILFSENNDEMTQSYLMLDPLGRFFSNQAGQQGYRYSRSVLEVGLQAALEEVVFDVGKFHKRYEIKQIA